MTASDWSLVIAERDASATPATFTAGDLPEEAPVSRFEGQDPIADVGVGSLLVPTSSELLDEFVQNRFLHLKVEGETLTTLVVGAVSETIVSPSGPTDELATIPFKTVVSVLNEGTVPPVLGFDIGSDLGNVRIFDFGDINRDNSDFDPVEDQGTVTAAQATYTDGYGDGIAYPDDVHLVGVPGSTLADDDQDGWCFLYRDLVFPDGTFRFRFRGVADNELTSLRVAAEQIQPKTWGYNRTWETDVEVTGDGVNPIRVSAVIYNAVDPALGPPNGIGPCNLAMEIIQLDSGGGEPPDTPPFAVTDSDWEIMDFPTDAPGMTFTQVARILLEENQGYGWLTDVVLDPTIDDETDSNGAAITEQWDMATRTRQPLGDFFLKEMGRFFCETKVRADEDDGGVIWELYQLGGRGTTATGYEITEDDVTSFRIDREGTLTTDLMVESALGTHLLLGDDPPAGQPRSVAYLTVGAQQTLAQALRLATPELGDFSRMRVKIMLTDVKTDGRDYWTADSIEDLPSDRVFTPAGDRVESMTWQVDGNGNIEFTPEFGDLVVPVVARSSVALSRMAPGSVGGRSRIPTP